MLSAGDQKPSHEWSLGNLGTTWQAYHNKPGKADETRFAPHFPPHTSLSPRTHEAAPWLKHPHLWTIKYPRARLWDPDLREILWAQKPMMLPKAASVQLHGVPGQSWPGIPISGEWLGWREEARLDAGDLSKAATGLGHICTLHSGCGLIGLPWEGQPGRANTDFRSEIPVLNLASAQLPNYVTLNRGLALWASIFSYEDGQEPFGYNSSMVPVPCHGKLYVFNPRLPRFQTQTGYSEGISIISFSVLVFSQSNMNNKESTS